MKIQKKIEYVNSHILKIIVKKPKSHHLMLPFYSFITIVSKLQTSQIKYLPELLIVSFEFFTIDVSVRLSDRSLHREEQKKKSTKFAPSGV